MPARRRANFSKPVKAAALERAASQCDWDPEWVDHVCEAIQSDEAPWPDLHCFARSKDGSPVHPVARGRNRIPDHAQPVLWRAGSTSEGAAA